MWSRLQGDDDDEEEDDSEYSSKDTITIAITITITNTDISKIEAALWDPAQQTVKNAARNNDENITITKTIKIHDNINTGHSMRPCQANSEHRSQMWCRRRLLLLQVKPTCLLIFDKQQQNNKNKK